jgi:hemoglobin-like flavoprotein
MLTEEEKNLVVNSWKLIAPISSTASDLFYRRLFELRPDYRKMFSDDMGPQKKKLEGMLAFIVKSLDWGISQWRDDVPRERDLFLVILAMGRRHGQLYRIPDESYPVVGEALIWALDYGLGEAFTPELKTAWAKVYNTIASLMLMGTHGEVNSASI